MGSPTRSSRLRAGSGTRSYPPSPAGFRGWPSGCPAGGTTTSSMTLTSLRTPTRRWTRMPLLHVDDVVVQFGGVTAVNHASFEVEQGTVTGLIGPNGAGKTTCFNVITGLQAPTSGRILLDGKDVTRMPVHRRARHGMGRTFQRLEAFGSLTVEDNVRVALDVHEGFRGALRTFEGSGDRDIVELLERV